MNVMRWTPLTLIFLVACTTKTPKEPSPREIDPVQVEALRKIAKFCKDGAYKSRGLCPEWRFHESRLRRKGPSAFDLKREVAQDRLAAASSLLNDEDIWARRIARGLIAMSLPLVNEEVKHAQLLEELLALTKDGDEETQLDALSLTHDHLTGAHQPLLSRMTQAKSEPVRAMGWRALSGCLKRGCELKPEEIIERYEAETSPMVRQGLMLLAGRANLQRVYGWCEGWAPELEGPCRNILLERDTPQAQQLLKARAERLIAEKQHGHASRALSDLGHTSLARAEWLILVARYLDAPGVPLKLRQVVARQLLLGKGDEAVVTYAKAYRDKIVEDKTLAPLRLDFERVIQALEEKEHKHGAGEQGGHNHGGALPGALPGMLPGMLPGALPGPQPGHGAPPKGHEGHDHGAKPEHGVHKEMKGNQGHEGHDHKGHSH